MASNRFRDVMHENTCNFVLVAFLCFNQSLKVVCMLQHLFLLLNILYLSRKSVYHFLIWWLLSRYTGCYWTCSASYRSMEWAGYQAASCGTDWWGHVYQLWQVLHGLQWLRIPGHHLWPRDPPTPHHRGVHRVYAVCQRVSHHWLYQDGASGHTLPYHPRRGIPLGVAPVIAWHCKYIWICNNFCLHIIRYAFWWHRLHDCFTAGLLTSNYN